MNSTPAKAKINLAPAHLEALKDPTNRTLTLGLINDLCDWELIELRPTLLRREAHFRRTIKGNEVLLELLLANTTTEPTQTVAVYSLEQASSQRRELAFRHFTDPLYIIAYPPELEATARTIARAITYGLNELTSTSHYYVNDVSMYIIGTDAS